MSGLALGTDITQSWLMNASSATLNPLNGVNVIPFSRKFKFITVLWTPDSNIVTFNVRLAFSAVLKLEGDGYYACRASPEGDYISDSYLAFYGEARINLQSTQERAGVFKSGEVAPKSNFQTEAKKYQLPTLFPHFSLLHKSFEYEKVLSSFNSKSHPKKRKYKLINTWINPFIVHIASYNLRVPLFSKFNVSVFLNCAITGIYAFSTLN